MKPLIFIGLALGLIASVVYGVAYFSSQTELTNCVVSSKDRSVSVTSDGEGNVTSSTSHRVYTSCGVFEVNDNLLLLKFNSADTYGFLEDGKSYNLKVVGWRNGFLSLFPNILEATAIN